MSRLVCQSFLRTDSDTILVAATIGVVGLGGGGLYVVQQAARLGIGGNVNFDPQTIEHTNTNRQVGGMLVDVDAKIPKTNIAERLIRVLQHDTRIVSVRDYWHACSDQLKACNVIIGAVDSFKKYIQLEHFARRYLIPYIDLGMDVHKLGSKGYLVSGQIIPSAPVAPYMHCCRFIIDDGLGQETNCYGAAGGRLQVVWSNCIHASTTVGLLVQILTTWYLNPSRFVYLMYYCNKGMNSQSVHVDALEECVCRHRPADETGDSMVDIHQHLLRDAEPEALPNGPIPWLRDLWRCI